MIIVEIKTRKQLKEAPLLDLINVGYHKRAATIGKAGMAADPEGFVKISKGLYQNTKQNLVIILPSARLLADIRTFVGSRSSYFKTPEVLQDILNKRGIEPDDVHVLIPTSAQIEKDNTDPLWTMVHDAIGHHLENVRSSDLSPGNYIPDNIQGEDLLKVGKALYAGVSKSHQAVGSISNADKDDDLKKITPEQAAELEWDDLFNVDGPLEDDRWADILGAIALDEYDENKVSSYLEKEGREDLKVALMEKVRSLKEKVKASSKWEPGFTTLLKSW